MKLYYFQFSDAVENFGDSLNIWLWRRLLDGYLDQDPASLFFGVGTLLNDVVAAQTRGAQNRVVFSSGVGYGEAAPTLDSSWNVYCVRGPLSAQALGLPPEAAVTDGAVLVRRMGLPARTKRRKYAFMPHIEQIADQAWRMVCKRVGFAYIDPRWPTETVLEAIAESEILVTEAMHGAIVADALRVPWIPVVTTSRILPFKWRDWCASVGVDYAPHRITGLVNPRSTHDLLTPVRQLRYWAQQIAAEADLSRLQLVEPILSTDSAIERVTSELENRLERFKADVAAGRYSATSELVDRARHFDAERAA